MAFLAFRNFLSNNKKAMTTLALLGPAGLAIAAFSNSKKSNSTSSSNSTFDVVRANPEPVASSTYANNNLMTTSTFTYSKPSDYSISDSFGDTYDFSETKTTNTSTTSIKSSKSEIVYPYAQNLWENSYYYDFRNMSKAEAERAAANSPHLEYLRGGKGWSVSDTSFVNDIEYAGKGMNKFLTHLSSKIGQNLVVTSALGTKNSPHTASGHYDFKNPKLDFGGGMTEEQAQALANKLQSTRYFSHIYLEPHGDGYAHVDVQVKRDVLAQYA